MEEALRPRSNTILHKTFFSPKKRFCLCFLRSVGFCNGYLNASLDLEPVWEARFCTVAYVNSFAKIFAVTPISQVRYHCILDCLWRSVVAAGIREFAHYDVVHKFIKRGLRFDHFTASGEALLALFKCFLDVFKQEKKE